MRMGPRLRLVTASLMLLTVTPAVASAAAAPVSAEVAGASGLVRVDQLGYGLGESKQGYLMTTATVSRPTFAVTDSAGRVVLTGRAGPSVGGWNARYRGVYPLEFSNLHRRGVYRLEVPGLQVRSVPFRIDRAEALWQPRVADAVAFFQAQRDGRRVLDGALHREPSHLNDAAAGVYAHPRYEDPDSDVIVGSSLRRIGGPVDLEGGWFDAGDFIKFTHTTAYADSLLLVAERDMGGEAPASLDREIRFGLDWLGKAWDPARNRLYIQVGIGSGNQDGTFLGDHDLWRLPEKDDALTGAENRYLSHRPAFGTDAAAGRLAPNQAGRLSAAFALAAQVDAAAHPGRARAELALAADIFARAKTTGVVEADVVTALPHAFYPESTWRDDMELGATELARAGARLHDPRAGAWLAAASGWAAAYLRTEAAGGDTLNLYDVSALAHAELIRAVRIGPGHPRLVVTPARLVADLRRQLAIGLHRAAGDPFQASGDYTDFDVASHTFGLVATAALYRQVTGSRGYDTFASRQRNWVFGANPWGASFMIGVGTTFPACPQHVVANLSGSLDRKPPVLRGAVVNGPNSADLFTDGLGEFFDTGRT